MQPRLSERLEPQGIRLKALALLATVAFSATQMMAFVLYPYFAEAMQLPLSSIISSFSLGSFLFLWGGPFWSRARERLGSKTVLCVGLLGLLLSQIVLLFLVSKGRDFSSTVTQSILWGSRLLYGMTAAAIVPVAQIIMAEGSAARQRMQALTRQSLSLHLGRLLGPFLVWLGLLFTAMTPLWLCSGFLLVLLLGLLGARDPKGGGAAVIPMSWTWRQLSQHGVLLGIALAVTMLVGLVQASLTHSLQTKLLLNASDAARLTLRFLLASSLLSVLIQLLLQLRIKHPWQGTFPLGALSFGVSTWLLARFQTAAELWWALPLFASGVALLSPSYTAALSLQTASKQGAVAGLLAAVHTLGYTAGGLFAAALVALGVEPLSAGIVFAALLLLFLFFFAFFFFSFWSWSSSRSSSSWSSRSSVFFSVSNNTSKSKSDNDRYKFHRASILVYLCESSLTRLVYFGARKTPLTRHQIIKPG